MSSVSSLAQGNYCSQRWTIALQFGFYWVNRSLLCSVSLSPPLSHTHTHTELEGRLIATGHTGEGLGRLHGKWSVTLEHTWGGVCAPHSSLCSQHLSWSGRYRTHINALPPSSEDHLQLNQQEICSPSQSFPLSSLTKNTSPPRIQLNYLLVFFLI